MVFNSYAESYAILSEFPSIDGREKLSGCCRTEDIMLPLDDIYVTQWTMRFQPAFQCPFLFERVSEKTV